VSAVKRLVPLWLKLLAIKRQDVAIMVKIVFMLCNNLTENVEEMATGLCIRWASAAAFHNRKGLLLINSGRSYLYAMFAGDDPLLSMSDSFCDGPGSAQLGGGYKISLSDDVLIGTVMRSSTLAQEIVVDEVKHHLEAIYEIS
jgi:hypothetical protein